MLQRIIEGEVMKPARRQSVRPAAGAAALCAIAAIVILLAGQSAWSQTPRTIKIVVPVPPGGGMDFLARVLADQIGRTQGVTVLIESRPGAASMIATEAVSRAVPDGSTLLIQSASFIIDPHVRKLSYDPLTGFEPVCDLVSAPNVIVVNSASPYRTLADLVDAARSKPGELTIASIGPASQQHMAIESLKRMANIDLTYVPYSGSAPTVTAVLGGHVTALMAAYANLAEQVDAGKLRALAAVPRTRIEQLPDVPTVAESGYKDFEVDSWFGVLAPAKTPKETVAQLAGWFTAAMQVPEAKAKLVGQGLYPAAVCGADFGALLRKQYDEYGRLVRETNIKAQ
jgi:tripartite-type tricarboxylate transporter receptor subunit TctC